MTKTSHRAAIIELQVATAIIAMAAVIANALDQRGWSMEIIISMRGWLGAAVLLAFVLLRGRSIKPKSSKTCFWMLVAGVFLAAHWVLFFHAVNLAGVGVGMIALFTFPVITALIEPFFFREPFHWRTIVNAALVLAGVAMLVPNFDLQDKVTLGVAISLVSALLFAVRNLLSRKFVTDHDGAVVMFWQALVVGIACSPWWFTGRYTVEAGDIALLAALGIICTGLGHTLFVLALGRLRAGTASIINSVQPIYGVIYALIFLGEVPHWRTAVAGAIILITVVVHEILTHRK